jgi:Beta-propeller repeat/Putative binding domain, N-terminal/NHL repeat
MPRINVRLISVVVSLVPSAMAQHAVKRHADFGNVPLYFEENRGQTDAQARYIVRSANAIGFVTQDGWTLSLHGQPISMHIKGVDAKARFMPEGPVEGITNYYLGARAITALPHYSSVRGHNIRPGVDIAYHGSGRDLEYDLVIHPGTDVSELRLRFEGSRPVLADNGDIVLKTSTGEVRQHKPRVWQEAQGQRTEVVCSYDLLESGEVGLSLANYNLSADLIVDPVIGYSTYLSGTGSDNPAGIAVDGNSYAYITGSTSSTDFPVTAGTYQGTGDVFVTKLNPSGTGLVYSTFIGGTSSDIGRAIAIDNAGSAYVTGYTNSTNFPVTVNQFTTGQHAFALKLSGSGNIVYSTALVGNNFDNGSAIAVDASGSAYVAGVTGSSNFPVTPGSYKTTPGGGNDAFVAKLNSTGQISYATYLGGSGFDSATAIAVDASGNAFVGGTTSSSNFQTTVGAYLTAYAGNNDAFVVKLNPAGSALIYATYLGGSASDSVAGLAIDAAGNCYITGITASGDFPTTPGAFSTTKGSPSYSTSGFVTKLSATGSSLVYSTFLGGNGSDSPVAIALDSSNAAYVAGSAQSTNFPTTPGALKTAFTPSNFCCDYDIFLSRVAIDGSALSYSTLLGSSSTESANGFALDGMGGAYIVGLSQSPLYPTTTGAYQASTPKGSSQVGLQSMVVTKIDFNVPTLCNPSVAPQSQNLPGRGGAFSFNLTLSPGCPWEAVLSNSFNTPSLTLNGPRSGVITTSPLLITGTAPQNPNTSSGLSQTVRIGTATFTVNQDVGSCQDPVISPPSLAFDLNGGIRNISLTLPLGCSWTAFTAAPWLNVSNNPNGTGPASITIFAGPNSFSPRSATLTIAGKPIAVTQSGSTCTATANILVSSTSFQGSDGVVSISTNSNACNWSAYATVPWIQLNGSASTGQGSGFVPFILAGNPGTFSRTGQILIADVTLSITQDAGPGGTVNGYSTSVIAGGGSSTTPNLGDGGPAIGAYLNSPSGLAFDPATGNLYIVDSNSRIRVVTPDGNINTFAGGGFATAENIPATSARLNNVTSVAVDSSSAVYINDSYSRVRRISQGNILTFAGGNFQSFGGDNGPATNASLSQPIGIVADSTGSVYIADTSNNRVRKVNGGTITTFAGGGNSGLGDNGPATLASLASPFGVALDAGANLLIADFGNGRVRKVAQGNITTIAGGGSGGDGGPATSASLSNPSALAVDPLGDIFIIEAGYGRLRKVSVDGTISTITSAFYLQGLTSDRSGNIYFGDNSYGLVRKLTPLPSFCTYSVSTPPQIPPSGGPVQISITAALGCGWGALLVPAWLTPSGPITGTGNGVLNFTASANSGTTPRNATLAIAGMTVPVSQSSNTASLSIVKTHAGTFSPGQQNAAYAITVSNAAGSGPTSSPVTVMDLLPFGLTPVSMSGLGWTCQNTSCTRSDALNGGASYAPITLTVNVVGNATSPQVNQASVSGGGSASASTFDSTTIGTPTFFVNRTTLNFAATSGFVTSPQTVTVTFTGGGGVPWTATSNQSNIVVTQGSGSGNGSFQVSGNAGPNGTVTVTAPNAIGSPKLIQVNISTPAAGIPFGSFDTPIDNTMGVAGAIPVTGWALDNVEVTKVDIWREPVGAEPAGMLINIGDAIFVEGARPDVEALNPKVPFNYRAGWGYQMLTNFLPNGNGTFKLHAIAHNKAGIAFDLGTKTIAVDNAHATKPFGTIDTPGQGGSASGNAFVNFGWALCPNPNRIPIDGSTISVIIDGQAVGHPTYNQFRSDIATLFPGYLNSGGAVGFYYLDTSKLSNGVHTISWNVFDNVGHGDGIGSRYFNVFNSASSSAAPEEPMAQPLQIEQPLETRNRAATVRERFPGNDPTPLEIEEVGQLKLPLEAISGYQLVNGEHRPLPIGSSLKQGVFYWQPGPGFLGDYNLVFERSDGTETRIRVKIRPKTYPQGL